jgi:DNA-binding NtrC family response regulator
VASSEVLVVEDYESLLASLISGLTAAGVQAKGCRGFEEAKKYLNEHRPDVLITDVRLGAFNGLHLVLLFKNQQPNGRAIAFSGFDDPVLREEAARCGALFLLKPLTTDTIISAIGALDIVSPSQT